jgi:hypothetical protein
MHTRVSVDLTDTQEALLRITHATEGRGMPFAEWLHDALDLAVYGETLRLVKRGQQLLDIAALTADGSLEIGRGDQDISTSGVWSSTDGEAA